MSMNVKDKTYRELGKLIVISGTMVGILLLNSSLIWAATKSTENVASEEDVLSSMTLEEKVAQMFFVTPEALTGAAFVTEAGEITEERFSEYPVGGIIYFTENIVSHEQVSTMLNRMQEISKDRIGLPIFLGIDEEGGRVSRLYESSINGIPYVQDMYTIGTSGDSGQAYQTGKIIGRYMKELNFNVDFAPVADIFSNPANTVIGNRAFGNDPEAVSEMVAMMVQGLQKEGIFATLKHFPGHGDTLEDSHSRYANCRKNMEELKECELQPFDAGISAGASFVMAGHISLPEILGDQTPASLSHEIISGVLREEMGFEGVIITDALNMGAISENYSSDEAVVRAVEAGVDMLLMPMDFVMDYHALVNAVCEGRISEERINESVRRIIRIKNELS